MVVIMLQFGILAGMYMIVTNADACSCWCYPVSVGNVLPFAVPRDWVGYSLFPIHMHTCTPVSYSSKLCDFVLNLFFALNVCLLLLHRSCVGTPNSLTYLLQLQVLCPVVIINPVSVDTVIYKCCDVN